MKINSPNRVSRSYAQQLLAPPATVFPLLCPVREADWIEGWDPLAVFSRSGLAEVDCVFLTAALPADAVWYITRHEPAKAQLEMLKITPQVTVCKISIELHATLTGSQALITYTHTSLGPAGDALVESFSEDFYRDFMKNWETRLNHYLVHGVCLAAPTV
jgi:hypothetical protein